MNSRPLAGKRVVITRAAAQSAVLAAALASLGATPVLLPLIEIVPPEHPEPLAAALRELRKFDGFIFTSANAVRAVFAGGPLERPARAWVCAVGPATAAALPTGWATDRIATDSGGDGVIAALAQMDVRGLRLLLPRAEGAADVIPRALKRRGAQVTAVVAYRNRMPPASAAQAAKMFSLSPPGADAVVFTSGSTARHLATALGPDYRERLQGIALIAIGPATRTVLLDLGLAVAATAADAGVNGLVAAAAEALRHA